LLERSEPAPQEGHLEGRFRLACRTRLAVAGEVRAHTLRRGSLRIETASSADCDLRIPVDPAVTRDGARILLDGEPVAESDGPIHGLALDLGTTTVALRLHDLETGRLVATRSFENPQRFGGSNVMSRIHYDGEHRGRLLQRTLLGYLTHCIEALPVDPATIYELVVAGNPTMRDLLFGLDVQGLGVMPYRSVTEAALGEGRADTTSLRTTAKRLRLPVHPAARVYGLPLVGSRSGGIPDVVIDGETGFLAGPTDAEAAGDALIRLASDPALAARLPFALLLLDYWPLDRFNASSPGTRFSAVRHLLVNTTNTLVASSDPGHLITTIGCENLIIIHTPDATLVCPADQAEAIKDLHRRIGESFGPEML